MVDIWAQEDGGIASLRRFGIMEEENGVERKGMGTEAKVKDKGESGSGAASGRKCSVLSQLVRFQQHD